MAPLAAENRLITQWLPSNNYTRVKQCNSNTQIHTTTVYSTNSAIQNNVLYRKMSKHYCVIRCLWKTIKENNKTIKNKSVPQLHMEWVKPLSGLLDSGMLHHGSSFHWVGETSLSKTIAFTCPIGFRALQGPKNHGPTRLSPAHFLPKIFRPGSFQAS